MRKNTIEAIIEAINTNSTATALEILNEELKAMDEASAKKNAQRTAKAKAERAEKLSAVLPVIRNLLADGVQRTAKDIHSLIGEEIGMTAAQVQYVLLHDMTDELDKVEEKGKPNYYGLKAE